MFFHVKFPSNLLSGTRRCGVQSKHVMTVSWSCEAFYVKGLEQIPDHGIKLAVFQSPCDISGVQFKLACCKHNFSDKWVVIKPFAWSVIAVFMIAQMLLWQRMLPWWQGQEKLHVLIRKNNTQPETSLRIHVGVDAKLLHFKDCHEIMSRYRHKEVDNDKLFYSSYGTLHPIVSVDKCLMQFWASNWIPH